MSSVHLQRQLTPKPSVPNLRDFRGSNHRELYPSLQPKGSGTPLKDTSYMKEVSEQYLIAPAFNKGAYQVIPLTDLTSIGRK